MMVLVIMIIMIIFEDKDCDYEDNHEANRDGEDNLMKHIEMIKIVGKRTMMRMMATTTTMVANDDCEAKEE